MTIATSQLATAAAQRDAQRQAANEQTIANFAPTVARMQAERIAELEEQLAKCNGHLSNCQDIGNLAGMVNEELKTEVVTLRAVAVAAEWVTSPGNFFPACPICERGQTHPHGHKRDCLYYRARAAGYLPAEGETK